MSNVLEMALEALQRCQHELQGITPTQDVGEAIAALKEAIKKHGKPAYWLSAKGDLFSSRELAERYRAAKPYEPLYTSALTIPEGWDLVNKQGLVEAMAMFVLPDCHAEMAAMLAAPHIVRIRWKEALAQPSIPRWRSLEQMCADMYITVSLHTPESPIVGSLSTLADVAHQHMLDMQPERETA